MLVSARHKEVCCVGLLTESIRSDCYERRRVEVNLDLDRVIWETTSYDGHVADGRVSL